LCTEIQTEYFALHPVLDAGSLALPFPPSSRLCQMLLPQCVLLHLVNLCELYTRGKCMELCRAIALASLTTIILFEYDEMRKGFQQHTAGRPLPLLGHPMLLTLLRLLVNCTKSPA
jgi:hypothetical protein